jgi:hypothetical protein
MKLKSKKALTIIVSVIFILLAQVSPVFAATDGPLRVTYESGLNLYQSQSTGSTVLMTMYSGEALAHLGDGSGTWQNLRGWKAPTSSIVNGWSNGPIYSANAVYAKYALTIHSNDSGTPTSLDVPANAEINVGEYGDYIHSNLVYLRAYNYYYNGLVTASDLGLYPYLFVHTNFRTTTPSGYYLTFTYL